MTKCPRVMAIFHFQNPGYLDAGDYIWSNKIGPCLVISRMMTLSTLWMNNTNGWKSLV
jgi:hypothetical protein